jgi:predicted nuclease of restriction endonuclease-like (RecB) superfamily
MAGKYLLPTGYAALLARVKQRVRTAQLKAALSANRELVLLYWDVGRAIVEAQKDRGYGRRVVEMLSADLRREFPEMAGFTARNLWFMRAFFVAYKGERQILKQPVSECSGRLQTDASSAKLKHPVSETLGPLAQEPQPRIGSQPVRQSPEAKLSRPTTDPYLFDFLTLDAAAREREFELGLIEHVGVAEWRTRLVESLPKKLQSSLPTVAQIEAELVGGLRAAKSSRK